jgi:hypothetical protein
VSQPPTDQVLALTRAWLERAVIGLNLCPFANGAYLQNQVRIVVSEAKHLDGFLDNLDAEIQYLRETPASVTDTTLLVHPGLFADFFVFNDFLNVVDTVLEEHDAVGEFQVVAFHPEFLFEGEAPDDMSHYTNRSPFPILHLLREDSLSRAIDAYGDTDAIHRRNQRVLRELGLTGWQVLLSGK